MTTFYKSNKERSTLLKQLKKRLSVKKSWTHGDLVNEHFDEGTGKQSFKFCFVGHLSAVLNPHLEFVPGEPMPTLEFPKNYNGGKDLVHRLAQSAWDLYGDKFLKDYNAYTERKLPAGTSFKDFMAVSFLDEEMILYRINDEIGGYQKVKKIVNHAVAKMEPKS